VGILYTADFISSEVFTVTLSVQQLQCSRGDSTVFQGLSFSLSEGQLLWLEGKNGSGKTTLLCTVCGLFLADDGEVLWKDKPIRREPDMYYRELLYIGHQNALKLDLTPLENLHLLCQLAGQPVSEMQIEDALLKMDKCHKGKSAV